MITAVQLGTLGYDAQVYCFAASLSKLVYGPYKQAPKDVWTANMDSALKKEHPGSYESIETFAVDSNESAVVYFKDFIAFVFRGTDEWADNADNADCVRVRHPYGKVHRGFYTALVGDDKRGDGGKEGILIPMLHQVKGDARPILVTGHSMGAALATLCAVELMMISEHTLLSLWAFASPRVGSSAFAKHANLVFEGKSHRVRNNNDAVTMVPGPILFRHIKNEYYINSSLQISGKVPFLYKIKEGILGIFKDIGNPGPDALNDHSMDNYLEAGRRELSTQLAYLKERGLS